jgi:insertion element IS1 protein InsB
VLELDELWSYGLCKERVSWIWLALSRRTRQVVAYAIGDRSEQTARRLWERIPAATQKSLCYTDFLRSYTEVLPAGRHRAVGKGSGETNHVERFNCTLRQRIGRLVRKTLSFSQRDHMHEICLRLFLHDYNCALRDAAPT